VIGRHNAAKGVHIRAGVVRACGRGHKAASLPAAPSSGTIVAMNVERVLGAAMRPAAGAVSAGLRLERAGRAAAAHRLGEAALSALDATLASPFAEEAVDQALASGLARRAVGRVFEGPLIDVIAEDVVRYAVVERIVDRLLAEGIVEHTVSRILDGPEFQRVIGAVLESEELWLLVEEIAESPAVTDAVTQQSFGFADQVAGGMRARSRNADAWLERGARRALRKSPR
jgi:hypothetical protein